LQGRTFLGWPGHRRFQGRDFAFVAGRIPRQPGVERPWIWYSIGTPRSITIPAPALIYDTGFAPLPRAVFFGPEKRAKIVDLETLLETLRKQGARKKKKALVGFAGHARFSLKIQARSGKGIVWASPSVAIGNVQSKSFFTPSSTLTPSVQIRGTVGSPQGDRQPTVVKCHQWRPHLANQRSSLLHGSRFSI